MDIGKLDTYGVITRPSTTEDEYGDLTTDSTITVASLWCNITEMKSELAIAQGKKRTTRQVRIVCRSEEVTEIMIDDEIELDGVSFQINDIYEDKFGFRRARTTFAVLIAEYKI